MRLVQLYQRQKYTFSFEFFPPKTREAEAKLFETLKELKRLQPSFVSVTYGAMGTTRADTLRIVSRIKNEIGLETAAHLACIGHTREEIEEILSRLCEQGIENLVALRGDRPEDSEFHPPHDGFHYASELVHFIRHHPRFGRAFSLAVAGYPEGHIECRDLRKDLEHLKRKVDEGADVVITQLFFRNSDYFGFVERARKIGIQQPVVPGIMPVTNGAQIERFARMCGAAIPSEIKAVIEKYGEDQKSIEAYGIGYAICQCRDLLKGGVPGIHFYTLNKSRATREIYTSLGLAG
ncbi:MAG: methylenetetrahydrofolate reductase [NAD(P)H] [Candidatus Omnitrophica bacterium]|nr:methylenetetrahydrofolate reductase [NAD(P)H] [Candidatus Omnitrophota bacterium]